MFSFILVLLSAFIGESSIFCSGLGGGVGMGDVGRERGGQRVVVNAESHNWSNCRKQMTAVHGPNQDIYVTSTTKAQAASWRVGL